MGLVARHEHHARSLPEEGHGRLEHAHLRVAVELQGVVLGHPRLHAAGGVEHEDVEAAECAGDLVEHRLNRFRIGEVCADHEHLDAERAQLGGELLGARSLVAVIDDDVRARLGEIAHGVGSDTARRAGHECGLAAQRTGRKRGGCLSHALDPTW
nr:hypothetical protein GCM10025699_27680 [Microbacterium flavescens]